MTQNTHRQETELSIMLQISSKDIWFNTSKNKNSQPGNDRPKDGTEEDTGREKSHGWTASNCGPDIRSDTWRHI
jgi:hypothetical protein